MECKICNGRKWIYDKYAIGGPNDEVCRHCNGTGIEPGSETDLIRKESADLKRQVEELKTKYEYIEQVNKKNEVFCNGLQKQLTSMRGALEFYANKQIYAPGWEYPGESTMGGQSTDPLIFNDEGERARDTLKALEGK